MSNRLFRFLASRHCSGLTEPERTAIYAACQTMYLLDMETDIPKRVKEGLQTLMGDNRPDADTISMKRE
jgi:hypothetical protein